MRTLTTQNIRLLSGLILFAFAATHFLNHAVGLFSLEAMDEVQEWRLVLTRSWPGMIVLLAALLAHAVLAVAKTIQRSSWRLPAWELIQLVTGLAIPLLLLPHIVETHVAHALFGVQDNYLYALALIWPRAAWIQTTLLLLVWVHGCLGLHHWLKFRRWYRLAQPALVVLAVAVPMAALMGFVVSGRAVAGLLSDPAMADRMRQVTHWPSELDSKWINLLQLSARIAVAALLVAGATIVVFRHIALLAAPKVAVTFPNGATVQAAIGPTLLEIIRSNRLSDRSECGGRARCGLCRVRVLEGAETLPPPGHEERAVLTGSSAPEHVRLACQIRPATPLTIAPLVDGPGALMQVNEQADAQGERRAVCLVQIRVRAFATIAGDRLASDLVFMMNEIFGAVSGAIEANAGRIDRFLGDGVLAVFGEQRGPDQGCRDALQAIGAIDLAMDRVNEKIAAEIGRPVELAIGVHVGEVVVGRLALGRMTRVAVLGTVTDVPARLAALAQRKGWQLALSGHAARAAGLHDVAGLAQETLADAEQGGDLDAVGVLRARDVAPVARAAPDAPV
ncbi:2Fe-2S iron-sulfur cluster binding domain-containing protein [Bradyrhizobium sp. 83002]|uniref:adenylate/guanylate cyclase domain-containing protein n=1 Tax=Bradyrhizobium aeschynomenes TaxID=2734909 RepID=UPI0015554BCB|nr:adenylate/guanylate cyclase domain-containing protein [Bradyrhizobium aeschynomenes]NPU14664.1 2Fe-2S iron-sulfur cluster binding domain-containing protein [Bradyrhizobium aeschynomenes]